MRSLRLLNNLSRAGARRVARLEPISCPIWQPWLQRAADRVARLGGKSSPIWQHWQNLVQSGNTGKIWSNLATLAKSGPILVALCQPHAEPDLSCSRAPLEEKALSALEEEPEPSSRYILPPRNC